MMYAYIHDMTCMYYDVQCVQKFCPGTGMYIVSVQCWMLSALPGTQCAARAEFRYCGLRHVSPALPSERPGPLRSATTRARARRWEVDVLIRRTHGLSGAFAVGRVHAELLRKQRCGRLILVLGPSASCERVTLPVRGVCRSHRLIL